MSELWDKKLLQAVLQSTGVGLMVQDRARRIVFLNTVFEEITGWKWRDIGGKECSTVFGCHTPTGKCLMDDLCPGQKVIEGGGEGEGISRELIINRGDGGERWVEVTVSPIKGREGKVEYIVSIFKDISEKKRYSEELLKTKTLATLGQLAAELAHEIKNPLNSIHIQLRLMEKELAGVSGESGRGFTELLSRTKEELRRLNELVNQCLSFSRSTQLYPRQEDLEPLLKDLVGLIEPQANLGGINVELMVEANLPRVRVDKEKFRQAILNLLLNAMEAMPDGGQLHLRAWHEVGSGPAGSGLAASVKLSIKDTGRGIPDEIKGKVFELF